MHDYYYKCLAKNYVRQGDYSFEAVRPEHIEKIRLWRNNQLDYLRQKRIITKIQQKTYFEKQIWPQLCYDHPSELLLCFKLKDKMIGYGGLVHISWKQLSAESSFLLDNKITVNNPCYKNHLEIFFQMLFNIAFKILNFRTITSETFEHRRMHIRYLEKCGFKKISSAISSESVHHHIKSDTYYKFS